MSMPANRRLNILLATCLFVLPFGRTDEASAAESARPFGKNLAEGKPVEFSREPNDQDVNDPDDSKQLVDGLTTQATPIWYDRTDRLPVGWTGQEPVEIKVDLGKVEPISGIALRAGAGKSGVAWPGRIKVSVSDDGETYAPIADLMETTKDLPAADVYEVVWLQAEDLKTHGRYVKLVVEPTDSGAGTYFYTDELEIYRGEDAWVSLPLPTPEKPRNSASPRPQWENLAAGTSVSLDSAPSEANVSDIDDAKQLTDGFITAQSPIWNDKKVVGWMGTKMVEFTVDLGRDQPIRGVALRMAAGQAGVEWPASVEVYVSDGGGDFTPVGDLMQMMTEKPPETGYSAHWMVADKLETHGRYVKFVFTPNSLGNGSYIFLDEVEVYRGEDAWLSKPLAGIEAPEQWKAFWPDLKWKEMAGSVPETERPKAVILIDGQTETGANVKLQDVETSETGVSFWVKGEAGKARTMNWSAKLAKPVSAEKCTYVVASFAARGIRRTYDSRPLVILQGMGKEAAGNEVVLFDSNTPLNDGLTHTIVRKLPEGFTLQQIRASVTTDDDQGSLALQRIEFLPEAPAAFNTEIAAVTSMPAGFVPIDIVPRANGSLAMWFEQSMARYKAAMDGVSAPAAGPISVSGAPFVLGSPARNLLMMPESKPEEGRVVFLRQEVDKCFLDPASRHDTLSVDVDANAREVLLLLAASTPLTQIRGGIPPTALRLDDKESLTVELTYDKGESEIAFPYSLADRSCFVPARELAAFAVAADPSRRLRKVTLHNRHFGPAFALAGLTLNTSGLGLVPELDAIPGPELTKKNPEPPAAPVTVKREGNRLTVANRYYEYVFDLSEGFVLNRLVNKWNSSAALTLAPSSGMRLRVGNTIYTGRCFKAEIAGVTEDGAEIILTSLRPEIPLQIKVSITAGESQELSFVTQATNKGSQSFAAELSLPSMAGFSIADNKDTRVFFPQYRTVDTAEDIALRAPYGPEFAVQFMGVYNRKAGVGLMTRTDNPDQRMVDFAMRKDATGVSGGVWIPTAYNELAPGGSRTYPKISLFAHGGDWHEAFDLYTAWTRSWYKPHRSQDKDFFLNAWDLMCYRTSNRLSWNDARVPPLITKERTEWLVDESLNFEKQRLGHVPDLIHIFNWTYNDKKEQNEYGVFGTPLAYEQVGGIEFFKKGIAEFQQKWRRPFSLYTMHDRIRISAVPDQKLVEELIKTSHHKEMDASDQSNIVRASGAVDGIVFLAPGNDRWIDFVINDLVTMQRDTGCQLVYIDVFPSFSQLRGYNGASPRDADMKVITRLREKLPADVAIWTEYPLTDVASQYSDGCLQYYFMDVSQVFARRYNQPDTAPDLITEMPFNVQRFSTPTYRTFGLPTYIETGSKPSQVDATFFNGEAFQEDTYRLHHSRIRERLNRGYVVKKEYTDCFNSPDPRPQVDTPVRGVVANLFPGKDRKLWTLFNGRPKTFSGVVLEIPHHEGAKYLDAWSGREISPTIENGVAKIKLSIDPQQMSCVVQDWRKQEQAFNETDKAEKTGEAR